MHEENEGNVLEIEEQAPRAIFGLIGSIQYSVRADDSDWALRFEHGGWWLQSRDVMTGRLSDLYQLTHNEAAAILALSVGIGEEEGQAEGFDIQKLYGIAEPVMERLGDRDFRMIP